VTASRRAAVLGHPIAHSLSPALHRAAHRALGLDWSYEAIDTTEEQLPAVVGRLDASWAGLSVTMPLKVAMMGLVHVVEPLAEVVGAVNTVLVTEGGAMLVGANTDVFGIVAALREGYARRRRPVGRRRDRGGRPGRARGRPRCRCDRRLGVGSAR
jgi:shikimate dehydrogenase